MKKNALVCLGNDVSASTIASPGRTGIAGALALALLSGMGCSSTVDTPRQAPAAASALCQWKSGSDGWVQTISVSQPSGNSLTIVSTMNPQGMVKKSLRAELGNKLAFTSDVIRTDAGTEASATFGEALGVGWKSAHVSSTDGRRFEGSVDQRTLSSMDMSEVTDHLQFADGTTAPALSAETRQAIDALYKQAQVDPASCEIIDAAALGTESVPGHKTSTLSDCNACKGKCLAAVAACAIAGGLGCIAAYANPLGFILGPVCDGIAAIACSIALAVCVSNCGNIGSACCPVACGTFCCGASETCLDSKLGLCCSAGTLACHGPHESCFNPKTETCLSTGQGCAISHACGSVCCDTLSTCADPAHGTCCSFGQSACNNSCCSNGDQCVNGACCPTERACADTCCGQGFVCNANKICVQGPSCSQGQYLCVSGNQAVQTCCGGNQDCCDGLCCAVGMQCCHGGCNLPQDCVVK